MCVKCYTFIWFFTYLIVAQPAFIDRILSFMGYNPVRGTSSSFYLVIFLYLHCFCITHLMSLVNLQLYSYLVEYIFFSWLFYLEPFSITLSLGFYFFLVTTFYQSNTFILHMIHTLLFYFYSSSRSNHLSFYYWFYPIYLFYFSFTTSDPFFFIFIYLVCRIFTFKFNYDIFLIG